MIQGIRERRLWRSLSKIIHRQGAPRHTESDRARSRIARFFDVRAIETRIVSTGLTSRVHAFAARKQPVPDRSCTTRRMGTGTQPTTRHGPRPIRETCDEPGQIRRTTPTVSNYFSSAVQFRTVVSCCCGAEDIGTTAMNRWPSAETVTPRTRPLIRFGILKSDRGALHLNPPARVSTSIASTVSSVV